MLNQDQRTAAGYFLTAAYPEGIRANAAAGITRQRVADVVRATNFFLAEFGAGIELALEDRSKSAMTDYASVIVFDKATRETKLIPLDITPALVKLDGVPIFMGHCSSAENLMVAILEKLERPPASH